MTTVSAIDTVSSIIGATAAGIAAVPAFVTPDMPLITYALVNKGLSRAFIVDGTNRELVTQLGRAEALRQSGDWAVTAHKIINEEIGGRVMKVSSYDLKQISTGRHLVAVLSDFIWDVNGKVEQKATVMEWNSAKSEWKEHTMVGTTCRLVIKNRADDTQFVTAYTKYHYLALMLSGMPIRVVTGGFGGGNAQGWLLNGFHSQNMWTAKLNPVELPTVAEIAAATESEDAYYDRVYAVMQG